MPKWRIPVRFEATGVVEVVTPTLQQAIYEAGIYLDLAGEEAVKSAIKEVKLEVDKNELECDDPETLRRSFNEDKEDIPELECYDENKFWYITVPGQEKECYPFRFMVDGEEYHCWVDAVSPESARDIFFASNPHVRPTMMVGRYCPGLPRRKTRVQKGDNAIGE